MSDSESSGLPTACKMYPCFADPERYCKCGYRYKVLMSNTRKNPMRRFARCKRYNSTGGCDHFEWIDDELCPAVKSFLLGLMSEKETLLKDLKNIEKIKEERQADKETIQLMKVKNRRLRGQVYGFKLREKMVTWTLMLVAVAAAVWVGVGIGFY